MSFAAKAALLDKKVPPCAAVFGDDYFFVDKFTALYLEKSLGNAYDKSLVTVFDAGQKDREVSAADIEEAVMTMSMFSEKKAVIVRDLHKLNKENLTRVYGICSRIPDDVHLILQSASSTDVRIREIKELAKPAVLFDFTGFGAQGAREAALEKLNSMGKTIDPEVLDLITEEANNDPSALLMELEKMCLYAGNSDEITKEHFNGVRGVEKGYDVWALTNAFSALDQKRTFTVLEKVYESAEPELILGAVFGTIKRIYIYKLFKQAGRPDEAYKLGGGGVNFIRGFEPAFKAPYVELAAIMKEADRKIKLSARDTARSVIYLMFEKLFQRLSGKKKPG